MMAGCVKQAEGSRLSGPDASLEEFKARLPLVEIIGRYVKLTRRGREHLGLCPFHKEKTPSFNVVEDKGFFHCFGCGAHGNAIDFVMQVEGIDFAQALERLAEITGLAAPRRSQSPQVESGQRLHAARASEHVVEQQDLSHGSPPTGSATGDRGSGRSRGRTSPRSPRPRSPSRRAWRRRRGVRPRRPAT